MRKDGKTGSGVDQETPTCQLVPDLDQWARGDGVEVSLGTQFPQVQGASHFRALVPKDQW
jgi:hypothetical protein